MLYQLHLHISKTRSLLLFVINIRKLSCNIILNFNKLVSDLDTETRSPDS